MKQLTLLEIPPVAIREYVQMRLRDFAIRQAAREQKRAEHTRKQRERRSPVAQLSPIKRTDPSMRETQIRRFSNDVR